MPECIIGIGVIFKMDFWTTRTNDSLEDCDAVLCFHGNLKFSDTRRKISQVVDLTSDGEKEDSEPQSEKSDTKKKTFNSLKSDLNTEEEVQVLYEQIHGKIPANIPTPPKPQKPDTPRPKSPPPVKKNPPKNPMQNQKDN